MIASLSPGCGGDDHGGRAADAAVDAAALGWSQETFPDSQFDPSAVWGTASNDVWAVGVGGVIVHYDGSTWTAVPSPTTNQLFGVWGTATDDVWAVGTEIVHYDGSAWSIVPGAPADMMTGVWASARNDAWLITQNGQVGHWDGATWTLTTVSGDLLLGIHGTSPSDVWISAWKGKTFHGGVGGFSPVATPSGAATEAITSIFAIGGEVWAGGYHRLVLRYTADAWSIFHAPSSGLPFINGISASSGSDVWFVGTEGSIQRYDGQTLADDTPSLTFSTNMSGVFALPNDVFVVGDKTVYHLRR